MKYLILLTMLVCSIGCGKGIDNNGAVDIETEFQPYVDKFISEALKRNSEFVLKNVTIKMAIDISKYHDGEHTSGVCVKEGSSRTIYMSKGFWDNTFEYGREVVLFHELGHCVLNREHNNAMRGNTGASIMYPVSPNISTYIQSRTYYLDELFSEL